MGSTVTGEEEEEEEEMVVTLQFRQITPDPGDFLDPLPASPTPPLVRSCCLESKGFGRQVPSSGLKINRGMAVLSPNKEEEVKLDFEKDAKNSSLWLPARRSDILTME